VCRGTTRSGGSAFRPDLVEALARNNEGERDGEFRCSEGGGADVTLVTFYKCARKTEVSDTTEEFLLYLIATTISCEVNSRISLCIGQAAATT
jgi:hypothetical protein